MEFIFKMFVVMIGISTVWRSKLTEDGKELLEALAPLPFSALELDYRISESAFRDIRGRLKKNWQVLSVHNYFPRPDSIPLAKASADMFLLSNPDKEERLLAIKATIKSIEVANDLEAQAVVIHLGRVEMENDFPKWKELYTSSQLEKERDFVVRKLRERKEKAQKYVDAALLSLDKLLPRAENLGIKLGIENRYYFHEIPNYEEIKVVLETFDGAPLGYWHDVGHAEVLARLGIQPHEKWLLSYGDYLLGTHIHDVKGLDDHLAPGQGTVNFDKIIPHLNKALVKVFEIHPKSTARQIETGLDYLKEKGLE